MLCITDCMLAMGRATTRSLYQDIPLGMSIPMIQLMPWVQPVLLTRPGLLGIASFPSIFGGIEHYWHTLYRFCIPMDLTLSYLIIQVCLYLPLWCLGTLMPLGLRVLSNSLSVYNNFGYGSGYSWCWVPQALFLPCGRSMQQPWLPAPLTPRQMAGGMYTSQ